MGDWVSGGNACYGTPRVSLLRVSRDDEVEGDVGDVGGEG